MKSKHLFLLSTFLFVACFTPGLFASPPQGSTHRFHHERPYPAFLENLPEMEQARFKKLFRENPETFRKEIRAYWKSEFEKQKAELDAIGKRYRETTDAELRKQLEQELRNKISQQFDKSRDLGLDVFAKNLRNLRKTGGGDTAEYLTSLEIAAVIEEALSCPYGTLFVVSTLKTLEYYPRLKYRMRSSLSSTPIGSPLGWITKMRIPISAAFSISSLYSRTALSRSSFWQEEISITLKGIKGKWKDHNSTEYCFAYACTSP